MMQLIDLNKEFSQISFVDELNNVLGEEFLNLNKKELIKLFDIEGRKLVIKTIEGILDIC